MDGPVLYPASCLRQLHEQKHVYCDNIKQKNQFTAGKYVQYEQRSVTRGFEKWITNSLELHLKIQFLQIIQNSPSPLQKVA